VHLPIESISSCVSSASTAASLATLGGSPAKGRRQRPLPSLLKRMWAGILAGDLAFVRQTSTVISEDYGSDILCTTPLNKHGWTALHAACYFARLDIVQYLCETLKVSVNTKSSSGWHSLTFAVMGYSATSCLEEASGAFRVI